ALPQTVTAHPTLQTLQRRSPTTVQPSTMQKSAVQPSTMQKGAVQPSTTQKGAIQPSTTQKGAVQPAAGSTQATPAQVNKGGQVQKTVTPAVQPSNAGGKTTMTKHEETPKTVQPNTGKGGEDHGHPKAPVEHPNEKEKEKEKKK
ncbi:MAG TPA: hypothetical protein VMT11_11230, partial [Myxococcaceae bacterium]|nr:hypothetical protein [Myxococcaceae bacterium]